MRTFHHYGKPPIEWGLYDISDNTYFDVSNLRDIFKYLVKEEFGEGFDTTVYDLPKRYAYFKIKQPKARDDFAYFGLTGVYGTPIVVSSDTYIIDKCRRKGYSYKLMRMKEYIAKVYGRECLMATVNKDNLVEKHILKKTGWEEVKVLCDSLIWIKVLSDVPRGIMGD